MGVVTKFFCADSQHEVKFLEEPLGVSGDDKYLSEILNHPNIVVYS